MWSQQTQNELFFRLFRGYSFHKQMQTESYFKSVPPKSQSGLCRAVYDVVGKHIKWSGHWAHTVYTELRRAAQEKGKHKSSWLINCLLSVLWMGKCVSREVLSCSQYLLIEYVQKRSKFSIVRPALCYAFCLKSQFSQVSQVWPAGRQTNVCGQGVKCSIHTALCHILPYCTLLN